MKKFAIASGVVLSLVLLITTACSSNGAKGNVIRAVPVGNLTATLSSSTGVLKRGHQELVLSFTDAAGKPVDVGSVSLNFHMPPMGSMAVMNDAVTFTTTATPGVYQGQVDIESGGEWQGQLAYEGPAGKGKTNFSLTAQ